MMDQSTEHPSSPTDPAQAVPHAKPGALKEAVDPEVLTTNQTSEEEISLDRSQGGEAGLGMMAMPSDHAKIGEGQDISMCPYMNIQKKRDARKEAELR